MSKALWRELTYLGYLVRTSCSGYDFEHELEVLEFPAKDDPESACQFT